jgi:hypothetical protein
MASKNKDQNPPLAGYGALVGTFLATAAAAVVGLDRAKRLPERVGGADLALLGVATYSISRTLTRDRVTTFLRDPFVRVQGPAGRGEVESESRGSGLQRAIGDLVICPFCISQWVAAAGILGLAVAPRPTRAVASIFALHTAAEVLNFGHEAAAAGIDRLQAEQKIVQRAVAA